MWSWSVDKCHVTWSQPMNTLWLVMWQDCANMGHSCAGDIADLSYKQSVVIDDQWQDWCRHRGGEQICHASDETSWTDEKGCVASVWCHCNLLCFGRVLRVSCLHSSVPYRRLHKFSELNKIWYVGWCRWVIHDGVVWCDWKSRSKSRRSESCKSGLFQSLSPLPVCM